MPVTTLPTHTTNPSTTTSPAPAPVPQHARLTDEQFAAARAAIRATIRSTTLWAVAANDPRN